MRKKINNTYLLLLSFLFLIGIIFSSKDIYIAPKLIINMGLLIYPITFLLIAIIYQKYQMKEAKRSIIESILIVLVFYLIASLFCSLNSTLDTKSVSVYLRNIFTPNYFELYNITFYYPNLFVLFGSCGIFYLSHYIFLVVYEACNDYVSYIISFIIAILIAFIIDQMLYLPIIKLLDLLNNNLSLIAFIERLTANFIIVVISSAILTFIYPLCLKKN